ncbi:MAG TPA: hypothetical protein VGM59_16675 [Dongiaceae bacterium]|jgi:anti-sigma factor RsiW
MTGNEIQDPDPMELAAESRLIRIMQYCDGALTPAEAQAVAAEIARDPEAARLAAELTAGGTAAQAAWSEAATGAVPLDLARHVLSAARGESRPVASGYWRIAAALVVGLMLGALALEFLHRQEDGLRLAGIEQPAAESSSSWMPALVSALDKDPALIRVATGSNGSVAVTRWFDAANGLHCAEFVNATSGAADRGGIACRKRDGGWDVILQDR